MAAIDFDAFEQKRLDLISSLEAGHLDKGGFLLKSFALFEGTLYAEPDRIQSVNQGVFYYFYFNTMAKNHMKKSEKGSLSEQTHISNEYYRIKEGVLFQLLQLFADEELEAYYVRTDSVKLRNKLVEIYVKSREKLIFHTLSPKTVASLKRRSILTETMCESAIVSYINKKYY